jgi:beta-glucosidase
MEKPEKELKAFAKTRLLQPGEQQTLQMVIPRQRLASWNETTHQWVVDNGVYTVMVGGNKGKLKIEN